MIQVFRRQILASLRQNRLQSLFVFITLAGAAVAMMMALALWQRASSPWEREFFASGAPDVVFYGSSPTNDFSGVLAMPGITDSSPAIPLLSGRALGDFGIPVSIVGLGPDAPAIALPRIETGRWLTADDTRGIVVDYAYAQANGLQVGDSVDVPGAGAINTFTIVGLSITLWRGPYPEVGPAYMYVLPETLEQIRGDDPVTALLMIRLADRDTANEFVRAAANDLSNGAVCCVSTWLDVRKDIKDIASVNLGLLSVLSVFTLLAAGFVIANTIAGRVVERSRTIALYKAIGETPEQITAAIVIEHLLLALPAGVIGLIGGAWISRIFLWRGSNPYGTSSTVAGYWDWSLPFLALFLALVALFAIIPAWRAGHIETTQALRPARASTRTDPSWSGRLAGWIRLPLPFRIGLKDLFARPARSLLTALSISLIVAIALLAIGAERTLADYRSGAIWATNPPELLLHRGDATPEETQQLVANTSSIRSSYNATTLRATFGSDRMSYPIRALAGNVDSLGLRIVEGRMFAASGEMVAGQGLLDAIGARVGDRVTAQIDGQALSLLIVGRYVEFDGRGEWGMLDRTTLVGLSSVAPPDDWYLQVAPGADSASIRAQLTTASGGEVMVQKVTADASGRDVFEIRISVYSIAAIVALIGIVNIVTTSLLDLRERRREIGMLKALGMTPREILAGALIRLIALALIGAGFGIVLGSVVGPRIYDHFAIQDGLGTGLGSSAHWYQLLLLVPATLLFAAASAITPIIRSIHTPPTEALRYE